MLLSSRPLLTQNLPRACLVRAGRIGDPACRLTRASGGEGKHEWWRLTLTQPLRAQERLTIDGSLEVPASGDDRWEVPLPAVLGADTLEGEVKLFLAGAAPLQAETAGLTETADRLRAPPSPAAGFANASSRAAGGGQGADSPGGASPWRSFRYSRSQARRGDADGVSLTLRGRIPIAGRAPDLVAEQAALTSYAEPGGHWLHHYRFQVANAQRGPVVLRLPASASIVAAQVDGRWLGQLTTSVMESNSLTVELPCPVYGADEASSEERGWMIEDGRWKSAIIHPPSSILHPPSSILYPPFTPGRHWYEIVYATEEDRYTWGARLETPLPEPDIEPIAVQRTWRLSAGMVPLSRSWRQNGGTGDWTEWEPAAGTDSRAALLVIRQDVVTVPGIGLAALFCLVSWWLHKSPGRWRLAFPLIWLAATGVALAWLPESLRRASPGGRS